MKALNQTRKNHILFGFLVLTLAMSKSWLATADAGRAEYSSVTSISDKTVVESKGKKIDVTYTIETKTRTGAKSKKIEDGKIVEVEGSSSTETEARISLSDCESCTATVILPKDVSNIDALMKEEAKKIIAKREKETVEAKKLEERKKKCEVVDVDGQPKETKNGKIKIENKKGEVTVNEDDLALSKAYISCLEDNDSLTLSKVRGGLSGSIRRLLMSEDEDLRDEGRELRDMIHDGGTDEAADYMAEMEEYDESISQIRELGEARNLNGVDNLAGCMNPQANRNVPAKLGYYSCNSMNMFAPRSQGEAQSMKDGYSSIQTLACQYMAQGLGANNINGDSRCGGVSRTMAFEDGINGRPVTGDGSNSPIFTHDGGSSGDRMSRMLSGTGSGMMSIPQTGSVVSSEYGMTNRYDQNALSGGNFRPMQQGQQNQGFAPRQGQQFQQQNQGNRNGFVPNNGQRRL